MTAQGELDNKLRDAAAKGDLDGVLGALAAGAVVDSTNDNKRTALMRGAYNGHAAVVKALLDAGADRSLRDSHQETAEDDARKNGHKAIVDILKTYVPEIETVDEVTFTRRMGDRTLQEIFNFSTRERMSLVRVGKYGAVEAMAVTPFSLIEDKSDTSLLRQAFAEHVKRGGTTDESLVFPGARARLPKMGGNA